MTVTHIVITNSSLWLHSSVHLPRSKPRSKPILSETDFHIGLVGSALFVSKYNGQQGSLEVFMLSVKNPQV